MQSRDLTNYKTWLFLLCSWETHLSIYKQNTLGDINRIVLIMAGETTQASQAMAWHILTS